MPCSAGPNPSAGDATHDRLGFGAGAFSYSVDGTRLGNERHPGRYAAAVRDSGSAFVFRERLTGLAGAGEMVALGLRTAEGVDLRCVERRFGVELRKRYGPRVATRRDRGLLEPGGRLRLARRGWRVADEIASRFV